MQHSCMLSCMLSCLYSCLHSIMLSCMEHRLAHYYIPMCICACPSSPVPMHLVVWEPSAWVQGRVVVGVSVGDGVYTCGGVVATVWSREASHNMMRRGNLWVEW